MAPAEQVITQVTSGDRWATLPSAPLVWETLLIGSGAVSELVSEGSSGVVGGLSGGLSGEVTNAGGSAFAGVSGGVVVSPSGVAVASGAVGTRLEAVVPGSGLSLGTATLQEWM